MPNQAVQTDSIINDVIEKDIIDLLGLEGLDKEKQDEYRKKAEETIYDRAFSRITDVLVEKGVIAEFEKVTDDEDKSKEFLAKHGIDLEQFLIEETLLYKTQMKTMADVLDAGIEVTTKSE